MRKTTQILAALALSALATTATFAQGGGGGQGGRGGAAAPPMPMSFFITSAREGRWRQLRRPRRRGCVLPAARGGGGSWRRHVACLPEPAGEERDAGGQRT